MSSWKLLSSAEQVAEHLRDGLLQGRWSGWMPGIHRLSAELSVNRHSVEAALTQLEKEGLLVPQGAGRRRQIVLPKNITPPGLRVGFLLYEPADRSAYDMAELRNQLLDAGHVVIFPPRTLTGLSMNLPRIARMVSKTEVDAWVVFSATSDVLEWFAEQQTPAIAYAGQYPKEMRIAAVGPGRTAAIRDLVRNLVMLGHRRIVWLARSSEPGQFFNELEAQGIPVGSYNKPTWEPTTLGFQRCLDSLFATTPPTALLIDETPLFLAAQNHLARRGILAPEHVSLVCTDQDPSFEWYEPSVAHITWDRAPVIRRIVQWVAKVCRGEEDLRATSTKSTYVEGGTVGPAPQE